jgi:hypothetical protein
MLADRSHTLRPGFASSTSVGEGRDRLAEPEVLSRARAREPARGRSSSAEDFRPRLPAGFLKKSDAAVEVVRNPFTQKMRTGTRGADGESANFLRLRFAGGANKIQREVFHTSFLQLPDQLLLINSAPSASNTRPAPVKG